MNKDKPRRVALYCRVSKGKQTNLNQLIALRKAAKAYGWQVVAVFRDRRTGKNMKRPGFQKLIQCVRRRQCDMVAVWSLSRASRSVQDLIYFVTGELEPHHIEFFSLNESIDTSSASGRMFFHFLAAIAQFEREHISERVCAGLERAKAQGKKLGRPRRDDLDVDILKLNSQGYGIRKITRELSCNIATVRRVLRTNGVPTQETQHKYDDKVEADVLRLYVEGRDAAYIALTVGCSPTTVRRIIKRSKENQHGIA